MPTLRTPVRRVWIKAGRLVTLLPSGFTILPLEPLGVSTSIAKEITGVTTKKATRIIRNKLLAKFFFINYIWF
jgi:hypothetical protein